MRGWEGANLCFQFPRGGADGSTLVLMKMASHLCIRLIHAMRAAVGTRKMCGFVRLAVTAECSVFLV